MYKKKYVKFLNNRGFAVALQIWLFHGCIVSKLYAEKQRGRQKRYT